VTENHSDLTTHPPSDGQLDKWNQELDQLPSTQRLQWALDRVGGSMIATSSFGIHSAVTLHLVAQTLPTIPIIFIDTGYLFAETYRYARQLSELLELNVHYYTPTITPAHQEALYGRRWEQGSDEMDQYLEQNKLNPMREALETFKPHIWLSGLRRNQSDTRAERPIIERQGERLKLFPIIDWDDEQVNAYIDEHHLPRHPLEADGYVSTGDWHSTTKLGSGMRPQDTRFGGLRRECGLHENSKWKAENQ